MNNIQQFVKYKNIILTIIVYIIYLISMSIQIIISATIILFTYVFINYCYKPKRLLLRYKQDFQKLGYKVKYMEYNFFNAYEFRQFQLDIIKHGDASYTLKNQICQYDVVISNLFSRPCLSIINSNLLKDYFSQSQLHWQKVTYFMENMLRFIGRGLIFSEGTIWKSKRKIISQVFNFQFVKGMSNMINQVVDKNYNILDTKIRQGKKIQLLDQIKHLTAGVVLKGFFGYDENIVMKIDEIPLQLYFIDLAELIFRVINSPIGLLLGTKLFKLNIRQIDRQVSQKIGKYRNFVKDLIKLKIREFKKKDYSKQVKNKYGKNLLQEIYLSNLMNQDKKLSEEQQIEELINEFSNFLVAGIDTSSVVITNILIELNNNEQIKKKLYEQIQEFIKSEGDYNHENLSKMKYLHAIIMQTLRKEPSFNNLIIRQSTIQTSLDNVKITKDTYLFFSIVGNNYKKQLYQNPLEFIPERWLDKSKINHQNTFNYIPFSAGSRNCIGQHLSYLEVKIAIIKFLNRYDYKLIGKVKRKYEIVLIPHGFETQLKIK